MTRFVIPKTLILRMIHKKRPAIAASFLERRGKQI